jgi:ferritin
VSEQIEEEALARKIMDKLKLIGDDKGGHYLFDRDLSSISVTATGGKKLANWRNTSLASVINGLAN